MVVYWILTVIHVVTALLLVVVVLLQSGRGGGLSGAFGGGGATQTVFGGRGAGDVMTRTTQIMGATFMCTSLALVLWAGRTGQSGLSEESQRFMDDIRQSIQQQQIAPAVGGEGAASGADDGFVLPPTTGDTPTSGDAAPAGDAPTGDPPTGDPPARTNETPGGP